MYKNLIKKALNFIYALIGIVVYCSEKTKWLITRDTHQSTLLISIRTLAIFILYQLVAAGVETLIWGETFTHFIDSVVGIFLIFTWLQAISEAAQKTQKETATQLAALGTLLQKGVRPKQELVIQFRELIQEAEDVALVRCLDKDGNYHVITGAIVDEFGEIILTEV